MELEAILAGLDPEQREAVTNIRGPLCIIAGAGTGKTRVITHRIAYALWRFVGLIGMNSMHLLLKVLCCCRRR